MTRREGEITRSDLQREWPHHVALVSEKVRGLKNGCSRAQICEHPFVRAVHVLRAREDSDVVVFCFSKPEDAEAFAKGVGGERLAGDLEISRKQVGQPKGRPRS